MIELANGRFVDVVSGRLHGLGTRLLLQGSKIHSVVSPAGQANAQRPDTFIDLGGRWIIPGLFNTHCHVQITMPALVSGYRDFRRARRFKLQQLQKSMESCLEHGVTTVRDVWCKDLRWNRALREQIARGEILGPRLLQAVLVTPKGGAFAPKVGALGRLKLSLVGVSGMDHADPASGVLVFRPEAGTQEVRDAVDRAIDERGAECIKVYEQREKMASFDPGAVVMTLEQLGVLCDRARARGLRVHMHHVSVESVRRAIQSGISSIGHLAGDALLADQEVLDFVKSGCILEPTVSLTYPLCWKLPDNPHRDHPRLDRLTRHRDAAFAPTMEEFWIPELARIAVTGLERASRGRVKAFGFLDLAKAFRYYAPLIANGVDNLKKLHAAGASLALSNDGGAAPPLTPAMVNLEISMLDFFLNEEKKVFTAAEALRISTVNAAKAIGLGDRLGTIETGKIADLVVLDGNPLEDLSRIGSRAAAVFQEGKLVVNNCGLKEEPAAN